MARRAALRRITGSDNVAYDQRATVPVVTLMLPVPVSVNEIYSRTKAGMRLSDAYSRWIEEAGWRLIQQRPGRIFGRYQLTMRVPAESRADLDNLIKAASDLLQLHGVVRNDRDASRIVLEWQREHPEAVIEVRPAPSLQEAIRYDHPANRRQAPPDRLTDGQRGVKASRLPTRPPSPCTEG